MGLLSALLLESLSRALGARKGLANEVLNAQARHLSMTKNSFGVQFTKCPRCEVERKSLASRYCSRCGKRLLSERGLKISWWVFETLRALLVLIILVWTVKLLRFLRL